MLEWVAISYSRGSSQPRDRNCLSCICFIGRRILYHWHPLYVFYPCFPIENERAGGNGEGEETSFGAHQVPSTVSGTWQFAQAFQPWPVGKGNGSHLFEKILIFDNGVKHTTHGGEPASITMSSLRVFLLSGQEDLSPVSIASTMHCLYLQYLSTLHSLILNPLPLFKTY